MRKIKFIPIKELTALLFIAGLVFLTNSCKRDTLKVQQELNINSLSDNELKSINERLGSVKKNIQSVLDKKATTTSTITSCQGTVTFDGKIGYSIDPGTNPGNISATFQYNFYLNLQQAFDMAGATVISIDEGRIFYTSDHDLSNQISLMIDYALNEATQESGIFNYYWITPINLQTTNSCSIGNGNPGGDGGNPPGSVASQSIITNQVNDPCLRNVINTTLNGNIKGKITEILSSLGESTRVNITIVDVSSLPDGADDAFNGQFITENGIIKFNLTISLNLSNLHSQERTASQEFVAGTIIHEAIHAYFRVQTGSDEKINEMDHQIMSNIYVTPMAGYLKALYGMSDMGAKSIVWRGLMSTSAYTNATSFDIGNGITVSKQDLQDMGVQYSLGILGKKLCE